ncbi:MAG: hypothetical protein FWC17_02465 [Treponema sp.]|nr:hypothetical protein [Treponema sp.]
MIFWYGILPIAGGFYNRHRWKKFRNRFYDLQLYPLLDYKQYRSANIESAVFKFTGGIESITDGQTLWVKGDDLTIPVSLEKTKCYLLPAPETPLQGQERNYPAAPELIRWNNISTLTESAKVFIGGRIKSQDKRLTFHSVKKEPLMVIFYNHTDKELTDTIIRAARTHNEYWNSLTPVFIAIGALILIYIAASFLGRPAFRLTVISAFIAVFIPLFPVLPPGFLFTTLYRRISWNARNLRITSDLFFFGLSGSPDKTSAKRYSIRAYILEAAAWFILLLGVCINIVFVILILFLFQVISF